MARFESPAVAATAPPADAERLFDLLTQREFCYLSRTRSREYRQAIVQLLGQSIQRQEPLRFFYDIGGGYHATPRIGQPLFFTAGLAELLVLAQIATFANRVRAVYPAGARFSLVIDNLCALLINDIPLESTLRYCGELRALIGQVGLGADVDVLVESEHFKVADVERMSALCHAAPAPAVVSRKQHDNVERFLGRRCSEAEAASRLRKYKDVIDASERLLESLIDGVHMTQRASPSTICFRPFPGGDSRIQCGEVVLAQDERQRIRPVLLTTANADKYVCRSVRFPDLLPPQVRSITHAVYIVGAARSAAGRGASDSTGLAWS